MMGIREEKARLIILNQGVNTVKQGAQTLQITETIASTLLLAALEQLLLFPSCSF